MLSVLGIEALSLVIVGWLSDLTCFWLRPTFESRETKAKRRCFGLAGGGR